MKYNNKIDMHVLINYLLIIVSTYNYTFLLCLYTHTHTFSVICKIKNDFVVK